MKKINSHVIHSYRFRLFFNFQRHENVISDIGHLEDYKSESETLISLKKQKINERKRNLINKYCTNRERPRIKMHIKCHFSCLFFSFYPIFHLCHSQLSSGSQNIYLIVCIIVVALCSGSHSMPKTKLNRQHIFGCKVRVSHISMKMTEKTSNNRQF